MKCLVEYINEMKEVQIKQKSEIEQFFKDNHNDLIKMFNPNGHILNTKIEYDDEDKSYVVRTNKVKSSKDYYLNPSKNKIYFYDKVDGKEKRHECDLDSNFINAIKFIYKNTGLDKVTVTSIV